MYVVLNFIKMHVITLTLEIINNLFYFIFSSTLPQSLFKSTHYCSTLLWWYAGDYTTHLIWCLKPAAARDCRLRGWSLAPKITWLSQNTLNNME